MFTIENLKNNQPSTEYIIIYLHTCIILPNINVHANIPTIQFDENSLFNIAKKKRVSSSLKKTRQVFVAGNVFNLKHNRALESPWMKKQNTTTLDFA